MIRRRPYRPSDISSKGQQVSPARRIALEMLRGGQGQKQTTGLDRYLEEARRRGDINALDAGLAQELALGVSRRRLWLEHILNRYLDRPLPKQANKVHDSLLLGIYQWAFLDRIPAHTVVDETVKLVKSVRTETGYHKLTNAIMRKVVQEEKTNLQPNGETPWQLQFSVPDWLASEAGQVFRNGDLRAFFEASNEPAPLNLRVVERPGSPSIPIITEKLRGEIIDQTNAVPQIESGRFLNDCLVVRGRGVMPGHLPSFRNGQLTAEDEAGQIVGCLTGARKGMKILDLCASPGGKTAHILDMCERQPGRLVATDIDEGKLDRLRDTLERLGLAQTVEAGLAENVTEGEFGEYFDLVLVDAPCSSLGTIRRHPEVRWRQKASAVRSLAKTQAKLMDHAALLVAPGGVLVYSVCTFTRQETDAIIDKFLKTHGDRFEPAPAPEGLPFDESVFRTAPGRWRTFTHRDGCDTFFAARLRRKA